MKLQVGITSEGLSLCFGECQRLEPSADANQVSPRGNYVYAHYDEKKARHSISERGKRNGHGTTRAISSGIDM